MAPIIGLMEKLLTSPNARYVRARTRAIHCRAANKESDRVAVDMAGGGSPQATLVDGDVNQLWRLILSGHGPMAQTRTRLGIAADVAKGGL